MKFFRLVPLLRCLRTGDVCLTKTGSGKREQLVLWYVRGGVLRRFRKWRVARRYRMVP